MEALTDHFMAALGLEASYSLLVLNTMWHAGGCGRVRMRARACALRVVASLRERVVVMAAAMPGQRLACSGSIGVSVLEEEKSYMGSSRVAPAAEAVGLPVFGKEQSCTGSSRVARCLSPAPTPRSPPCLCPGPRPVQSTLCMGTAPA